MTTLIKYHDCVMVTTRFYDAGDFPQLQVNMGTRVVANLTRYETPVLGERAWWLHVGGDIVCVGKDEKEAVSKALEILGYVNVNSDQ